MRRLLFLCFAFAVAFAPAARADSTVVFNEIMYHPASSEPTLEWLELHNQMAVDMDLSGWSLRGGVEFLFPPGTIIPGHAFRVVAIAPTTLAAVTGLTNVLGPFTGRLANSGERLELRNNNQRMMDAVNYKDEGEWPEAADGSGLSLAKIDPDRGSAPGENWKASQEIGGTPGRVNFPPPGANTITNVLRITTPWRFQDDGVDPGPTWTGDAFDDRAWTEGAAPFYAGNPASGGGNPERIVTLYSTGLNDNGARVSGGSSDSHFFLTASAQGSPPPPAIPALVINNHPAWFANDAGSAWLGPVNPGTADVAPGAYNYRTTFDLSDYDAATARVTVQMASDNRVNNVLLNGVAQGIQYVGFSGWSPAYVLKSGFLPGTNTLEFLSFNDATTPNPSGFRAQLSGTAAVRIPRNTAVATGPITHYFRTTFLFRADVTATTLQLRALVEDGAIFYLNGTEVWRVNMPSGPVNPATWASAGVTNASFTQWIPLPSAGLLVGTNVFSAEVHQAAGTTNLLFAAELQATTTPSSAVGAVVSFNEVAGGTNVPFWVELANGGTNAFRLDRCVMALAGAVNRQYIFPADRFITANEFLAISETELGFRAQAGDKIFLFSPDRVALLDAITVKTNARARWPDFSGRWLVPNLPTPGSSNHFLFHREIVINEIMFHPANNGAFTNSAERSRSWVELHNRTTNAVDLTGWEIDGGIDYSFPNGTTIGPGGFLVVAADRVYLETLYPGVPILGSFSNQLSRSSDRLVLRDEWKNPVNEVTYFDAAPWPAFADGGGSSLELTDPNADNSKAEAWRASDERSRSSWKSYSYQGVASATIGPTLWNEFVLGLLDGGEILLDDLSVIENPIAAPRELLRNGPVNGATSWRLLGNHRKSRVESDPDDASNTVLHLIADGSTEHMHNHIETTLIPGATIVNGREYRISFRAKWLSGARRLNTRLYFNRVARTTVLDAPPLPGTPGAPNSRRVPNLGPTYGKLLHQPSVPAPGEPVTISVNVQDADGIASCVLWSSVNGASWAQTRMSGTNGGRYEALMPGRPAGSRVQFCVEAFDNAGMGSTYPAAGKDSRAIYGVDDGQAVSNSLHSLRLLMTSADADFLHSSTNVMSNERLKATVLYDDREVFYDAGIHLQGSERGRDDANRVGFTLYFPSDHLFRGIHDSISIDRSGGWSGRGGRQDEIIMKHMINRAGGLPGMYDDLVRVIAPKSQHTGNGLLLMSKFGDEFLSTQYPSGDQGNVFKLELIYYPLSTVGGNPESPKLPQPDDVIGTDLRDLGSSPENYRWNLALENNRDDDNYTNMIQVAKAFSLSGNALETQTRQLLDVSEWMRAFVMKALSGDGDTYGFGYPHNFMIYFRPADQKALAFIWDMDFAWARSPTDSIIPSDNIGKLVRLPANQRLFYGHLLDILNTTYNTTYMSRWTAHYGNLTGENYSGILDYIGQRGNFARSQIPVSVAFAITSNGGQDFMVNTPTVSLSGNAGLDIKEIRVHGRTNEFVFTWPTLQQWAVTLPVMLGTNVFNFVVYDFQGNIIATDQITVTSTSLVGGSDSDRDGIPDEWEIMHGLDPLNSSDATVDFDGDGFLNREEFLAGTEPYDPTSRLELRLLGAGADSILLGLDAVAGRGYSLLSSSDLSDGSWITRTNIVPAVGPRLLSVPVAINRASKAEFFRFITPSRP